MASNFSNFLKEVTIDSLLVGIATIVVGLLFILLPASSGWILCVITGIALLTMGIFSLYGYFSYGRFLCGYSFIVAILFLIMGALCLTQPMLIMGILTIVLGLIVIVDSATTLAEGIAFVRARIKGGMPLAVFSAILMLLGIFIIMSPAETVMIFTGWVLVLNGVFDIVAMLTYGKKIKDFKKSMFGER